LKFKESSDSLNSIRHSHGKRGGAIDQSLWTDTIPHNPFVTRLADLFFQLVASVYELGVQHREQQTGADRHERKRKKFLFIYFRLYFIFIFFKNGINK
jgi:hypothetical protein